MKLFMENPCMHPHCQSVICKGCRYFTPKAFGVRVPKWMGYMLFDLEAWLVCREFERMSRKF